MVLFNAQNNAPYPLSGNEANEDPKIVRFSTVLKKKHSKYQQNTSKVTFSRLFFKEMVERYKNNSKNAKFLQFSVLKLVVLALI